MRNAVSLEADGSRTPGTPTVDASLPTPSPHGRRHPGIAALAALLAALGCGACTWIEAPAGAASRPRSEVQERPLPIDAAVAPVVGLARSWNHRLAVDADLDGDGRRERLVLASDVTVNGRGRPLWEDGHRWLAWVETADGAATVLYARFVPLGSVEAAITGGDAGLRVTILERGAYRREAWEVAYAGPGRARVIGRAGGPVRITPADILQPGG